jgi:hypothetical protein
MDQLLLGKVMQILAERPIIPVSALQGSLSQSGSEGKKSFSMPCPLMTSISLDHAFSAIQAQHKLQRIPVPIKSETQQTAPVLPPATTKRAIAVLQEKS